MLTIVLLGQEVYGVVAKLFHEGYTASYGIGSCVVEVFTHVRVRTDTPSLSQNILLITEDEFKAYLSCT